MLRYLIIVVVILTNFLSPTWAQVDHWETALFADAIWSYRLGDSEPPADWLSPTFDASTWASGPGSIGYGDGDDNTIISPTLSLYMRTKFEVVDLSAIEKVVLHADYDDAFVAYLNGVEIARGNFPDTGMPPAFDDIPPTDHEAGLYEGISPEAFWLSAEDINTLLLEGENTLAIQVHNYLISSSDMTSNFFVTFGINNSSSNYQTPPSWFFPPLESTHLPLLRLNTQGQTIQNNFRITASLAVVNNGPGNMNFLSDPATGYDGQIAIEIRGASSQGFPKKNYGFETQDEVGNNNNIPLLGMPAENDWILHGPFSDKSLIRNALSFQIGRQLMPYASRTHFCELVINGDYKGVYLLMEKIKRDPNRVDIAKLNPEDIEGDELTGGYILQIDRDNPDIEEDGWYSPRGNNPFYAYHHPNYDDLLDIQRNYIRTWINNFEEAMDASDYATTYTDYIDLSSFIDYFLINELTKHVDAFKLSFYMYKTKDSDGGKLHLGPIWDFNLAFSNFDFECPPEPNGWIYPCTSRAFWLNKLLQVPAIQNQMNCRWEELRDGTLSNNNLMGMIDELVTEIDPAVAANFNRWNILGQYVWPNTFVGNTHAEEIDFMKEWLEDRLAWMDQNMFGTAIDCVSSTNHPLAEVPTLEVSPNPSNGVFRFFLQSTTSGNYPITIFNELGKQVSTLSIVPNVASTWIAEALPAGIYFYKLQSSDKVLSGKLVLH